MNAECKTCDTLVLPLCTISTQLIFSDLSQQLLKCTSVPASNGSRTKYSYPENLEGSSGICNLLIAAKQTL